MVESSRCFNNVPLISCPRSCRALRDGSFEGRFPGTSCQATIGVVPTGHAGKHFATPSNLVQLFAETVTYLAQASYR
jgi:hypothetical protein